MFLIRSYTSFYCQYGNLYKSSDELIGLAYLMSTDYNPLFLSPTRNILEGAKGTIIYFKTSDRELKFNKLVRKYYKAIFDYYKKATIGYNYFGVRFIDGTTRQGEGKVRKADIALAEFLVNNMKSSRHDFSDAIRAEHNYKTIPSFNEILKWKDTSIQ